MLIGIIDRIEKRLAALGLNGTAASRAAGLNPGAIRDLKRAVDGKKSMQGVRYQTLEALAPVLKTSVAWLQDGSGPESLEDDQQYARPAPKPAAPTLDIPIMGTAAGTLGSGAFQFTTDPIEFVPRPQALANAKGIYGVYVVNDSMAPEHKPGDLRIAHPGRHPLPGDTVLVQVQVRPDAPIETYIKTLVKITATMVVCTQLNPPATIEFRTSTVRSVHKILTTKELFGV